MSTGGISGLGSGIDWSKYVQAARAAEEQAVARTLGRRQAKLSAQEAIFSNVKGLFGAFQSSAKSFSFVGDFKTKTVNSSNTSMVTGSATVSALNQSATIKVEQLATNEVWHMEHTGIENSVSTGGTFALTVRGVTTNITVESGTTLRQLADKINQAGIGVTAGVFDTGSGTGSSARLYIQDNALGKFNTDQTADQNYNISIDTSALNATAGFGIVDGNTGVVGNDPIIQGKDSKFYLNGNDAQPIYRDTNTVTDVIPGVTLTLKDTTAAAYISLTVSESTSQAGSKVANLLKKFNDIIANLRAATAFNPNEEVQSSPTAGDGTLRSLSQQVAAAMMQVVDSLPAGNSIKSLSDLGIRMIKGADGKSTGELEINESVFNDKLASSYDDVLEFFQGGTIDGTTTKYKGWADKMAGVLESILKEGTGSLTGKLGSIGTQLKDLGEEISKKVERINLKEERMKDRFARLESTLAKLSGQQSSLSSALSSIALNNQAIARR